MTLESNAPADQDAGRRAAALLRLVFFFSGAAGLIYQVVWQRLLTVYYGVGPVATTLIVSIYMLGLGLGALVGGAAAERIKSRVTLYMFVELLLGLFGAASPWLLDLLGRGTAGASYPVAMAWMALFLSLPTLLMGATLPLLTKAVNAVTGDFLKSLSLLYFINTLGAAVGALTASFVIISLVGLDTTAYVAAAVNLLLAAAVFPLRRLDQPAPRTTTCGAGVPPAPAAGTAAPQVVLDRYSAAGPTPASSPPVSWPLLTRFSGSARSACS